MKTYKTFRELERSVRTPEAIARTDRRAEKKLLEMDLKEMRQMLGAFSSRGGEGVKDDSARDFDD